MNNLYWSAAAVLVILVYFLRSWVIASLRNMVNAFDLTMNPQGCIDTPRRFKTGMALCKCFKLKGPEFGVGDLSHVHSMAYRSFERAIKNLTAEESIISTMNAKLEQLRSWRLIAPSKKLDQAAEEMAGESEAHA